MLLGDVAMGRFVPHAWRDRLVGPLRLVLATPYLVLFVAPHPAVAVAATFVASVGYAASLPLQERLVRATDDDVQGQTMGLHGQGLAIWQALGALLAGGVATVLSPATAIGVMAVASLVVTALNTPGLRRSAPTADGWVSASANPSA